MRHSVNLMLTVLAFLVLAFSMVAPATEADDRTDARLKRVLQKFPDADANKDGVLTLEEAKQYRDGRASQENRARAASGETDISWKRTQSESPDDLKEGARCLFMGHSFFIPVAKTFDELASKSGFDRHEAKFVMSGGGSGAPGRLWDSQRHRQAATAILETGMVDLIGMTYFDESACSVDDYRRWIDLAIKHNPKTQVFIGLCWPDSPAASTKEFDDILSKANSRLVTTVAKLREIYPDVSIRFVNYGQVASQMKLGFSDGSLSEVNELIARQPRALFRDGKGHAGPLLLELSAMTWIQHLYQADLDDLDSDVLKSKSLTKILPSVAEFNRQFE
ncbi:MAG: hypothetical protein AAGG48_10800 [Planctomycetota bacterium]